MPSERLLRGGNPVKVRRAMNEDTQISKISERVFVATPPNFYSYFFVGKDVAIIDSGPGQMIPWVPAAYPIILNSLKLFGLDKASVKWLLICEPHPDHIGGLKNLLSELPNAQVATSEKNAEEIRNVLGGTQCRIVNEGDEIDLRGARIRTVATPGHTEGQLSFFEMNDKAIAIADSAGFMYIQEGKAMVPAPFYNFRVMIESIRKIQHLRPKMILTGHNGAITAESVAEYLDAAEKAIMKWEKEIMVALKTPRNVEELDKILLEKFPEMKFCPNPAQTSMISSAMTRILELEGKIQRKTVRGKALLESV